MSGKKINKELLFVVTTAAVCCGFMVFTVMFFPAVVVNGITIDGLNAIFGANIEGVGKLNFNLLGLIGYLLSAVSIYFSFKSFNVKSNLYSYIAVIVSLLSALLIILEPLTFTLVNGINSSLAFGPVLGCVLAIIVAICNGMCITIKNGK